MLLKLKEKFQAKITGILPGYLAIFNFADAKRRNIHLGFQKVDEEIAEFSRLLDRAVGNTGYSMRVEGSKWLGFFATNPLESMQKLLHEFYQEQKILVGWKSIGRKDGIQKSQVVTIDAKIYRAMHCVYTYIERIEDFEFIVEEFRNNDYGLPVNIPHKLEDIIGSPRSRWQCVSQYPSESPNCPFCQGNSFDWQDGDDSVYGGDGFCNTCGAEVSFYHAG